MNQNIDCYENSINVAGDITEVVDFTINYTKKLLYRTNRTVFSVSDLDGENEIVSNGLVVKWFLTPISSYLNCSMSKLICFIGS